MARQKQCNHEIHERLSFQKKKLIGHTLYYNMYALLRLNGMHVIILIQYTMQTHIRFLLIE